MLRRLFFLLSIFFLIEQYSHAQVTTSSITGSVKETNGQALEGATVTAIHTPSGTTYTTIATKNGIFNLPNVRIGGPYTIRVTFSGQQPFVVEGVMLELGQPYSVNAVLGQGSQALETVVVSGRARRILADRTGMSTNITNRQLTSLPTITRSITDFTRLTPQANGTNFAGRDARFNNITIDGANLNNNFGLSNDPLPGAGNNPVSLDAIDEISVNIAPFDVRQGQFTGGNIAASTKSGTNTFHGTAYTFWQNQGLVGKNAAGNSITVNPFSSKIYGGSIGGPIIKNKLFFFINGEYENKPPASGITWTPKGGSGSGNVSDVPIDSLKKVADYVTSKGFSPGVYDNFPNFNNTNHKALGKIDWNISNSHKLTLKYSDFKGTQDFQPSQSGGINGASSQSSIVTYGPKFSKTAMGFFGTTYQQVDIVRSGSLELNSNFRNKFSNQFLATITKTSSDKIHNGAGPFPFVDILGATVGSKNNFISVGNEPFNGNNNSVINDIYSITDNFSYFVGKHTLTAGLSYEYQKVGNMFMAGSQGYYVFKSVDDFVNNRAPALFSITYSLDKNQPAVYSANLKIGQAAAYIQDEINVSPKLRITAGVRADKPVYVEQPLENPAISALNLYADNRSSGAKTSYTTGQWPKATILLSPRVGFRYDVYGDKSLTVRGGVGIFTGRIPFVYLTNIPSNSGMYQFGTLITAASDLQNFKFSTDPNAYNPFYNTSLNPTQFPTTAGKVAPTGAYALTAKDFQFPQVFRFNVGADKQFANSWRASAEALYTKDLNAVYMFNANQNAPNSLVYTGPVSRGYYTASGARKLNSASGNAIVLDNTDKGYSFVLTAQLSKTFSNHFFGSIAYNYTDAQDVTANPGSQAGSVWSVNPTSATQNDLQLFYSNFAVPHRVIASGSYRIEYAKHFATTISLFYEGKTGGTYTYIYNGDLNNDGNSADLMYIPRNPSEIQFKNNVTYTNGVTYTAQQQSDIFFQYIEQDPYLKSHKGLIAGRNEAKLPWFNRVDAKVAEDIFNNFGNRRHSLQFTADIYNVLNLINNNWGIRKQTTVTNPLKVESVTNGIPTFSLSPYNGAPISQSFVNNISSSTTYSIQLGLRYNF